jgi:hypothetical protein
MLSHQLPHPARFENTCASARRTICMCLVACGLALLLCSPAHAQGGVPLVTVATDRTPLNLSNQFGIPAGTAINQAGDFAFVGNGNNALFFRAAGSSTATRLLQVGDEMPGITGSLVSSFSSAVGLNSSKTLLFAIDLSTPDGEFKESLLTYDGTNYHTVVSTGDMAPLPDNVAYSSLIPGSINDEGDINFAAFLAGKSSITYYILPSGATTAVRIVASDDPIPTACMWCSPTATGGSLGDFFSGTPTNSRVFIGGTLHVPPLNAKGQMLISLWGGLFIGSKDQPLSLVHLATSGVCGPPTPSNGGTISAGIISVSDLSFSQGLALNNMGAVAFIDTTSTTTASTTPSNLTITSAICVVPPGGGPVAAVVTSGNAAPAAFPGGTLGGLSLWAMNDSGDIAFSTGVSTVGPMGTTLKSALLRYHASGAPLDVVAYDGEVVPAPNGFTIASPVVGPPSLIIGPPVFTVGFPRPAFSGVSMSNDGRVSFHVELAPNGNAICQQTGTGSPVLLSRDGQTAPVSGGGTFDLSVAGQTITLDNGSTFYSSYLSGGTGDFAEFLGTPASVHPLVSTGDTLPSGARIAFVSSAPKVAGTIVAFIARPAGGRSTLLETDISSSVPTAKRIVSDGEIHVPGTPGLPSATSVAPNFFVNENGDVAFEIQDGFGALLIGRGVISFGSGNVNPAWLDSIASRCGAIYLWSHSTASSAKVAAAGDLPPSGSTPFSCVELNAEAPSPLNKFGQLAFSSPSTNLGFPLCSLECFFPGAQNVNGVFLYSPGSSGTISEMAAANDTLPGETQPTTFVPDLPVPVNSAGQVAFGAQVGTPGSGTASGFQGFFLRNAGDNTFKKIVSSGDNVPGSSGATFIAPHYITGLDDSGNLTFTAATSSVTSTGTSAVLSTAADGIFFAPAGGGIQTIALDGGAAPVSGGGTFALASPPPVATGLPWIIINGTTNTFSPSMALANAESDVVFRAGIAGGTGTPNSGYFRRLFQGGSNPGVKPVVLQGDPVPGGGTFSAIPAPPLSAEFALGPDGALAFVNYFLTSGPKLNRGLFVARPDGTLASVLSFGDTVPGGGTLSGLAMTHLAAGEAGKFAFWAGIKGGSARQAIFATAIPPGTANTTTALGSSEASSVFGQQVTLTATVNSAATGTPSGRVSFFDSGVSLGAGTVAVGQATMNISSLQAGANSIVAQYSGDTNFAPSNSSAFTVNVVGFAPPPTNLVITAGQSLVIPLTIYGAPGLNMTFMLSCSGLPAGATCGFGANPVTPGTPPNGTAVQLTLSTMAGSTLLPSEPRKGPLPLGTLRLAVILSALLVMGTVKFRQAPRRRLAFSMCLAVFTIASVMVGCGTAATSSGSPGTPKGLAAFTVTGTSGSTTITTVVNMTVQ